VAIEFYGMGIALNFIHGKRNLDCSPSGSVEKPVIEELEFVGTGLVELVKSRLGGVPVLTPRRTATLRAERTQCEARAVPTITSPC